MKKKLVSHIRIEEVVEVDGSVGVEDMRKKVGAKAVAMFPDAELISVAIEQFSEDGDW